MDDKLILAIDPGNVESAIVLLRSSDCKPLSIAKTENDSVISIVKATPCDEIVIEMVASYGMPVGASVFETCVMIGRLLQTAYETKTNATRIFRQQVKLNICRDSRAKDGNIIQALIDRFAPLTPNRGKGTKKDPGWFYGFKADIWQAYALGVTFADEYINF